MNASNATQLYYYTERTNDLVTFNLTLTSSVTLNPVTYDSGHVLDNRVLLSTQTQGEQWPEAKQRFQEGVGKHCNGANGPNGAITNPQVPRLK